MSDTATADTVIKPTHRARTVDVTVRWGGTVLAVERLAAGESFTLGAGRASPGHAAHHFVCDDRSIPTPQFPLVSHLPDGVVVRTHGAMTLAVDGAPLALAEAKLASDACARVRVGPLVVDVRPARQHKAVRGPLDVDARFLRISGTTLVAHLGLVLALLIARNVDAEMPDLSQYASQLSATTLRVPPPPVKTAVKQKLDVVKALPTAVKRDLKQIPRATRDNASIAKSVLAALGITRDNTRVGFRMNATTDGLRGIGAAGIGGDATGMGARDGVPGFQGGDVEVGGFFADGEYPRGQDPTGLRTRGKPETRLVVENVRHEDGLSRDEIQRVMERLRSQVKNCYERELGAAPDLEGKVALGFVIAASGDVATTMLHQNTLAAEPGARAGSCIQRVVGRAKFPAPRGGGTVAVTYPFVLSSSP